MDNIPEYRGTLRSHLLDIPRVINQCSGIRIFGRKIRSLVFSTDVAIIKNVNADAIIAVYPFSPRLRRGGQRPHRRRDHFPD